MVVDWVRKANLTTLHPLTLSHPHQIIYTQALSTPGVTVIRGGLSAGGQGAGDGVRGQIRNMSVII